MINKVLLFAALLFAVAEGTRFYAKLSDGALVLDTSGGDNTVAWADYQDANVTGTGWGLLQVHTDKHFADNMQARAGGYLEGYMTAERIYQQYLNTFPSGGLPVKVVEFLQQNQLYLSQQIMQNPNDPYWYQISLVMQQLQGLVLGYNKACSAFSGCEIDPWGLLYLSASSDIEDIEAALTNTAQTSIKSGRGRCSALIKLLPDNSDLFISHVSWSEYVTMLRIYKLYDFPFASAPSGDVIPGFRSSFSSYPGSLFSGDDFYVMSSGLVAVETTTGYDNTTLNQFVQPNTVLDWMRNIVANRLAVTAPQWTQIFAQHNSGTYNNEWLVVDYKLFTAGQPLQPNTVWLLDQIPGYIDSQDITALLNQMSYFPSYNVPYSPTIFNISGFWPDVNRFGDWFTYDKCPRANIFRRDHTKVNSLETMQRLMRYNDFQHDPLAACDCQPPYSAENAISARSDLNPANGTYPFSSLGFRSHGSTDAKMTSSKLVPSLSSYAVCGPTHDQQPVFQWSTSPFQTLPHHGHPDRFDFDWTEISWK
eukprot:TRINITY_DN3529_c0_g1_i3.p1 TRINITY_DN3529_c0_g1~~TRINITY_DN3529_c0_g1_i3.p1  ORF type:complete len:535 (-),score=171.08 TRINITY_DN3529_c0_g1_i3:144-1748(-)